MVGSPHERVERTPVLPHPVGGGPLDAVGGEDPRTISLGTWILDLTSTVGRRKCNFTGNCTGIASI